jgi:hypothetical protein
MESRNVNPSPSDDTRLEELLRLPAPPIPDDSFSTRVLAALPERRRARPPVYRAVLLALGALAGTIFAASRGSLQGLVSPDELASLVKAVLANASASSLAFALLVTVGALAYAWLIDSPSITRRLHRWRTLFGW